jgi:hypothetical protein
MSVLKSVAEKKVSILSATGQAASSTGLIWALTQAIIQGDSVFTRDGSQIRLEQTHLKLEVFMPTAAIAASTRFIVFSDSMNNGSLPAVLDVLNTAALLSPFSVNQQLTNRFKVHADVVKSFTAGGIQQVVFDIMKPINKVISYNASGDTAAANGKNSLFMLVITDLVTNVPLYNFSCSNRFYDM